MRLIPFAGYDCEDRPTGGRPAQAISTECPILKELFRIAQEDRGWNQTKIAKKLKRTNQVVSGWKLGHTYPSMFVYREFADVLGVKIKIEV